MIDSLSSDAIVDFSGVFSVITIEEGITVNAKRRNFLLEKIYFFFSLQRSIYIHFFCFTLLSLLLSFVSFLFLKKMMGR